VQDWQGIVSTMPGIIRTYFRKAHLSLGGDDTLLIILDDSIGAEMLSGDAYRQEITEIISKSIGREIQIQIQKNDTGHAFEDAYVDLEKVIQMDIEYEDD